jgi:23S rRNA (adenine1618-N6)-methyltransferase
MHPRNRHQGRYDFEQLVKSCPELAAFVIKTPRGDSSIDFANPAAVQMLNRALLKSFYGISHWEIPAGYLSPPIPGRADYVHRVAELLRSKSGSYPRGDSVRVLDVGVGANCIYPIIGRAEYGWRFVGSDVDPVALDSAKRIVDSNPSLTGAIELRLQASPEKILEGIVRKEDAFDIVMCNPPFHASLAEAEAASRRKWTNLGRSAESGRNFGGQGGELWFPGGEAAFVRRMVEESAALKTNVRWFTALISKEESLPLIQSSMRKAAVTDRRAIAMEQGQKKSRIVAWTFQ